MANVSYQGTHSVRCGACQEAFSFEVDVQNADAEQDLFVDVNCRWCQAALVLNLKPYLRPMVIMKSPIGGGAVGLDLPEELIGAAK